MESEILYLDISFSTIEVELWSVGKILHLIVTNFRAFTGTDVVGRARTLQDLWTQIGKLSDSSGIFPS